MSKYRNRIAKTKTNTLDLVDISPVVLLQVLGSKCDVDEMRKKMSQEQIDHINQQRWNEYASGTPIHELSEFDGVFETPDQFRQEKIELSKIENKDRDLDNELLDLSLFLKEQSDFY